MQMWSRSELCSSVILLSVSDGAGHCFWFSAHRSNATAFPVSKQSPPLMRGKIDIEVEKHQQKIREVKAKGNIAINWRRDSVHTSADFSSHICCPWFLIPAEVMIAALWHFLYFPFLFSIGKQQNPKAQGSMLHFIPFSTEMWEHSLTSSIQTTSAHSQLSAP